MERGRVMMYELVHADSKERDARWGKKEDRGNPFHSGKRKRARDSRVIHGPSLWGEKGTSSSKCN